MYVDPKEFEIASPVSIEAKRELIEASGGRFASVEFIKKDGSLRRMSVQPASLKFHLKGDDASESAKQAALTRKARHPNLMPIWDVEAAAIRSINLETVTRIAANGAVYAF